MVYVMSDIHGNINKYEKMLMLINFSEEDELYVLGDVIDRGAEGVRILEDIMNRPNRQMLKENHELMAVDTLLAENEENEW